MLNIKIFVTSILTLILLGACSTITPPPAASTTLHHLSWSERQQQLRTITAWNIRGALSITYNEKTDLTSFEWQKKQDNYFINIHGPMNVASTNIIGNQNQVVLQQASGKQIEAETAEELMQQQLGWSLPLNNLNYWIRGLPAPHINARSLFDSYNHIQNMTQHGWQITYADYGSFSGIDLPTKIYLTSPQLRAKIVIKQWNRV